MNHQIICYVGWLIFARECDLTTGIAKVTVDRCKRAFAAHMMLEVLTLRLHPTLVRTGHWVTITYVPVAVDYVLMRRLVIAAEDTTKGPPGAFFILVGSDAGTEAKLGAVNATNFSIFTAEKLLIRLRTLIQMFI